MADRGRRASVVGLAFLPLGTFGAGLSFADAAVFAIGLLVANVPEGLLPTITLALAVGVRVLARQGALVKRLSAVETLGSTTVICTDKTGTLTENRMRVTGVWTTAGDGRPRLAATASLAESADQRRQRSTQLAEAVAACTSADVDPHRPGRGAWATRPRSPCCSPPAAIGVDVSVAHREANRRAVFHFDPALKLMSTVDADAEERGPRGAHQGCARGGPRPLRPRFSAPTGVVRSLGPAEEATVAEALAGYAAQGPAGARRGRARAADRERPRPTRARSNRASCFLGLVAMFDPPRPEVADAVARCHTAGIRVIVVTGDHGLTAAEIAGGSASTPRRP